MRNDRGARLRSVVFVLEGGVTTAPANWSHGVRGFESIPWHRTFPAWLQSLDRPENELREELARSAREAQIPVRPQLRELLERIGSWPGLYRSVLSGGPREWVEGILNRRNLGSSFDDVFHYDRYPHGDRQVLLKFLQNRFVANGPRTLLIGGLAEDETLARREQTRFVSLEPVPEATDQPARWEWSFPSLKRYINARRPSPPDDES